MSYWTVAESCTILEEVATDLIQEASDSRESLRRQRELEAVRLRNGFKLIRSPKAKLGFEEIHWRAAEYFSQYDPEEARNLLGLKDPTKEEPN